MNKLTLALALGTGLTLGLAAPSAQADAVKSDPLMPTPMTAADFNSKYSADPIGPAQTSTFQFAGAPVSGTITSQVFDGPINAADGKQLYAYAYQVGVNNVTNGDGNPVQVNATSWRFNGSVAGAYNITNGTIGGLTTAPAGVTLQDPSQLNFVHSTSGPGAISAQFLDTKAPASGPLNAGSNSSTFVIITEQAPTKTFANISAPDPTVGGLTQVYASSGTTGTIISPIPAPEPTTVLAWAGVLGGIALVRRTRRTRIAVAVAA